jgi:hypothetical protein
VYRRGGAFASEIFSTLPALASGVTTVFAL